jgi:flagellar motor switch protein FliN
VVELGRARLSGAQLLELSPGDVVSLERPLDAPLELRVADRLVARGELCSVDGETGIRLLELYD